MKIAIKNKIIFLVLLLLASQLAKAQGMGQGLDILIFLLFVLAGLILLAFITLIIFIINRKRAVGIVSAISGFIVLLVGVGFSMDGGSSDSTIDDICNWLKTFGGVNLALLFVFSKVFPQKARIEPQEFDPDLDLDPDLVVKEEPDRSGEPIIKGLSFVLVLWFFYNLNSSFQYLKYTSLFSSDYESSFSFITFYSLLLHLLPLVLLAVCISLLISYKRPGWTLLLFYSLYSCMGCITFILRSAIFKPANQMEMPIYFQLIQFSIVIFFALTLWLILRPNVRLLYAVDKKSSLVTLSVCAAIALFLVLLSYFIFSY